jgi:hypothetical protein
MEKGLVPAIQRLQDVEKKAVKMPYIRLSRNAAKTASVPNRTPNPVVIINVEVPNASRHARRIKIVSLE